ncbi:hypothetical protein KY389_11340 [Paracoccus bogoriensis]|nr:hypothetical protein [Paracoccus bogoriensis]
MHTITRAIARDSLPSVKAIQAALGRARIAGSCRPELRALLARAKLVAAEWLFALFSGRSMGYAARVGA